MPVSFRWLGNLDLCGVEKNDGLRIHRSMRSDLASGTEEHVDIKRYPSLSVHEYKPRADRVLPKPSAIRGACWLPICPPHRILVIDSEIY